MFVAPLEQDAHVWVSDSFLVCAARWRVAAASTAAVAFARRWPATHPIARLRAPEETPCGESLLLWRDTFGAARDAAARRAVDAVLLDAATGAAAARALLAPAAAGALGAVTAAFDRGGVAAIDYARGTGVVAACSRRRVARCLCA